MTILFYDTETTGLPVWHEPSGNENQPHIVSLAALLTDDDGNVFSTLDLIVRPAGWEIPQETIDLNGITPAIAETYGIDEFLVVQLLVNLAVRADLRVGHSQPFDARILRIALKRQGMDEYADTVWKPMASACTMQMAGPILKAAGKSKKLTDAYEHFIGTPHKTAHTAMGDTLACKAVYFAIKNGEAA